VAVVEIFITYVFLVTVWVWDRLGRGRRRDFINRI
jgi:hypothetical protein